MMCLGFPFPGEASSPRSARAAVPPAPGFSALSVSPSPGGAVGQSRQPLRRGRGAGLSAGAALSRAGSPGHSPLRSRAEEQPLDMGWARTVPVGQESARPQWRWQ